MQAETGHTHRSLAKAVLLLQLKLLLGAARDFILSPLTLAAAALDVALAKRQSPRYFQATLRLGRRSDDWIDLWSDIRDLQAPRRENVDALMTRLEDVLRDPQSGARRARVLRRWAQRQVTRARRQLTGDAASIEPASDERAAP